MNSPESICLLEGLIISLDCVLFSRSTSRNLDQVGAEKVELLEDPEGLEVLNAEICFTGSLVPHFGHTGGAWVDESSR